LAAAAAAFAASASLSSSSPNKSSISSSFLAGLTTLTYSSGKALRDFAASLILPKILMNLGLVEIF
jgi:hypothetical protein